MFKRSKSIKGKMLKTLIPFFVLVFLFFTGYVYVGTINTTAPKIMGLTKEISETSSLAIQQTLEMIKKDVFNATNLLSVKSMEWETMKPELEALKKSNKYFDSIVFSGADGKAYFDSSDTQIDISERSYFKDIMNGKEYSISDGLVSKSTGKNVFVVAYPVVSAVDTSIKGMLAISVSLDWFKDIMNKMDISEEAYPFISDGTGLIIVHPKDEIAMKLNIIESDSKGFKDFSEIGKKMIAGESGDGEYEDNKGIHKAITYKKIEGTPNWSFGFILNVTSILREINDFVFGVLIIAFITIIIVILMLYFISKSITDPIAKMKEKIKIFSAGDLTVQFEVKGKDEIAQMAEELNNMAETLRSSIMVIHEASSSTTESSTELSASAEECSASIEEINAHSEFINSEAENISESISQITTNVDEISVTSGNVSLNAQELADKIGMVNKSTEKGLESIIKSAKDIREAAEHSESTAKIVVELTRQADNVERILTTINSITEQTNLLALNAAIEAARAGEAGRGFSVVADEIRKLAEGSKTATSDIGDILVNIKQKAQMSNEATTRTVDIINNINKESENVKNEFEEIMSELDIVFSMIESLSAAMQQQNASTEEISASMKTLNTLAVNVTNKIKEMTQSISQITQVAQEVSASSEELSAISEELNEQIDQFKY